MHFAGCHGVFFQNYIETLLGVGRMTSEQAVTLQLSVVVQGASTGIQVVPEQ